VNPNIVVVGMGQLGEVFARCFLRAGFTTVPVLRSQSIEGRVDEGTRLLLLAVGEADLDQALASVPNELLPQVVLLQNELRPASFSSRYQADSKKSGPTILVVWFEKKGERPPVVVLPSVLFGPQSELMQQALAKMDLPARRIDGPAELAHELALKNLYILGLNLSGLRGASRAGELLDAGAPFEALVDELISLEQAGQRAANWDVELDHQRLRRDLELSIQADPNHGCAGRTAPERLARTLELGEKWGVALPECLLIAAQVNS
jgi:ketopantoate reductase